MAAEECLRFSDRSFCASTPWRGSAMIIPATDFDCADANPRLHVEAIGASGPRILFLHGLGRCGRDFVPLMPWLANRRVTFLDHRGHGQSARADGAYQICDYTSDVVRWLANTVQEPIDLYGHSLGALVALQVAAIMPQAVRSVVLEEPPSATFLESPEAEGCLALFAAMQQFASVQAPVESIVRLLAAIKMGASPDASTLGMLRDGASLRMMAHFLRRVDPDVYRPPLAGEWFKGYDLVSIAAAINCPVLLLRGEVCCGGMLPEKDAIWLAEHLQRSTSIRYDGAGHLLHWQQMEKTVRHLLEFLESI